MAPYYLRSHPGILGACQKADNITDHAVTDFAKHTIYCAIAFVGRRPIMLLAEVDEVYHNAAILTPYIIPVKVLSVARSTRGRPGGRRRRRPTDYLTWTPRTSKQYKYVDRKRE